MGVVFKFSHKEPCATSCQNLTHFKMHPKKANWDHIPAISPRPDQNIQRKSLGIRRPCFFFPRSYPYQHFDLVLHLNQNAVDSLWVSQIGESSCVSGPSSSARTLSNFSLTTSCIASFISFLLEVMKTTARVF